MRKVALLKLKEKTPTSLFKQTSLNPSPNESGSPNVSISTSPLTELGLNTKGATAMLKRSVLCAPLTILRRAIQSATMFVVLKRMLPLFAIILCGVMLLSAGRSASGARQATIS
jgi:hypothetical protein